MTDIRVSFCYSAKENRLSEIINDTSMNLSPLISLDDLLLEYGAVFTQCSTMANKGYFVKIDNEVPYIASSSLISQCY